MSRKMNTSQVGIQYGFRSGLEERFAKELTAHGVPFEFEKHKFAYKKPETNHKYTPDFRITMRPDGTPRTKPLIIETKGRFLTADRQKQLCIKRQHPDLDLRFIFSNPNQKISKQSKTTYASWCDKHGFQYAKEHVPPSWLEE